MQIQGSLLFWNHLHRVNSASIFDAFYVLLFLIISYFNVAWVGVHQKKNVAWVGKKNYGPLTFTNPWWTRQPSNDSRKRTCGRWCSTVISLTFCKSTLYFSVKLFSLFPKLLGSSPVLNSFLLNSYLIWIVVINTDTSKYAFLYNFFILTILRVLTIVTENRWFYSLL